MGKFVSFIAGGIVGAAVGLLLAPRTGEETRAIVADKVDEYWGKGQTFYSAGKTRVQESFAEFQPNISAKGDELRAKIDNARTLIADQVAKNAAAARDAINDRVPVAAEKINQVADVVRGQIDSATAKVKSRFKGDGQVVPLSEAQAAGAEIGEDLTALGDELDEQL